MNRFLAATALTAALFTGAASAQVPLAFSDAGIDYTNSDLDNAYLSLQTIDGELVLTLDDQASDSSLPAIAFDVPDNGRTDFFGNDIGAVIGDIAEVQVLDSGLTVQGIDVTHESVTLREATAAYTEALEAQGFSVQAETASNGNMSVLTAGNGDGSLRIVLHRASGDVTAHLVRS